MKHLNVAMAELGSSASNSSLELPQSENPSKIPCTSLVGVQKIYEIVNENLSSSTDNCLLSEKQKKEFQMKFAEQFQNAIFENITIQGLPPEVYKDTSISTLSKEEKGLFINQKILPRLGQEMLRTTKKRKSCPKHCCRVLQQRLKHERQNLKSKKVIVRYESSVSPADKTHQENMENLSSLFSKIEELSFEQKAFHLEVFKHIEQAKKAKGDAVKAEKICSNVDEFDSGNSQGPNSVASLPKKSISAPSVI